MGVITAHLCLLLSIDPELWSRILMGPDMLVVPAERDREKERERERKASTLFICYTDVVTERGKKCHKVLIVNRNDRT